MRSWPSASASKQSGQRNRKKHKRLDAISEALYNSNHQGNGDGAGPGPGSGESELRRSSRARRAPVILDLSPAPPKKRRRVGRNVKEEEEEEEEGGWKSRLRARRGREGFRKGKRKLFEEVSGGKGVGSEVDGENEEGEEGGRPKVVKSKRPGRVRATHGSEQEENEVVGVQEEVVEEDGDGLEQMDGGNERETAEGDSVKVDEVVENMLLEEECIGNEEVEAAQTAVGAETMEPVDQQVEQSVDVIEEEINDVIVDENDDVMGEENDKQMEQEQVTCVVEGEDESVATEAVGVPTNEEEVEGCCDGKDSHLTKHDGTLAIEVNNVKLNMPKVKKSSRIKEGRRCGLCGGGTDGVPPKILSQDMIDIANEAYSGSSASEKFDYNIWDGFGDEPGWLGRLLGPINDRYGIAGTWVHQHCAVWSPEVYFAGLGCLKNIRAALYRGRALKCTRCGRPGATIGCRVDRCPRTYHLPCARAMNCVFDHRKFLIACTGHRKLFQPLGYQYLAHKKKLKVKKMKLEIKKVSNDAWRKDIEAEEKWLEKCGDDEEFLKRESKRLHRDLVRIAPVYIGGSNSEGGQLFQGWESVAGLQNVIRCMKEVVILPLLYPEFFDSLSLTPPRGVLLHGYPGTGKTLVVRALIGACAHGDKRIAYFARKGADCLGKYVGDAERQLRLLFQVAEKCQPSIIFFDEIDGLAPSRTRQQDQTHSSVVSTLLALMDGLKSRGSVVVIGATNRPDAIDPALRRPGRFDREIYFPLPSEDDRASILSVHTQKWPKPVSGSVLKSIAKGTAGFAGADLQALCTQAAMISLKRNFPLHEVLSAAGKKDFEPKRLLLPSFVVEDKDWLEALTCSPPPCSRREVGIAANEVVCSPLPTQLIPCLLQPLSTMLVSLYLDERLWLPKSLRRAATMIESVVVSALNRKNMLSDRWWSHIDVLLQEADVAKDIERKLLDVGILNGNTAVADTEVCNYDDVDDGILNSEISVEHNGGTRPTLLQNRSDASTYKPGFRILIAGNSRSGQRHLASCLLHCFVGNVEIQKVDLATVMLEGHGDIAQGITQILKKCSSMGSCVIFMPRIDLWAVETPSQVIEDSDADVSNHQCPDNEKHQLPENQKSYCPHGQVSTDESGSLSQQCKSEEILECQSDVSQTASHAWNLFVEQVESLSVSSSFMILATSEVPCPVLPVRIRQFFKSDLLNGHRSVPVKHTVPRFSVQVDGNFDHDLVINSSSAQLSRDLVQQIVLLVHQTSHIHTTSCKDRDLHVTSGQSEMADHSAHPGSADANNDITFSPVESHLKAPPPPSNPIGNGKSSLLLAISSFGYQILRYPHFAELCWFTSKLKEGPSADVSGPWKGWPFNSCIVRPSNSLEMVALAKKSKSKENSSLVRGLIAVGLSAYRGFYTSLREVSSEVRKVLEILVAQINAKVQAGKDRYQYVRLLSQVAYLEDVVNSWAYTLQSLEQDGPMKLANSKLITVRPPDDNPMNNQVWSEDYEPQDSRKCSDEHEVLEVCPEGFDAEKIVSIDMNEEVADLGSEGRLASFDSSGQKIVLPDSALDASLQDSAEIMNDKNGTHPKPHESDHTVVTVDSESWKRPNGFKCTESDVMLEDSPTTDIFGSVKLSSSVASCNNLNGLSPVEAHSRHDDGKPEADGVHADVSFSSITSLPECLDKPDANLASETNLSEGLDKANADEHKVDVSFSNITCLPKCLDKPDENLSSKDNLPECVAKTNADEHDVDVNFSPKSSPSTNSGFVCGYHCCSECLDTLHSLTKKILIEKWRSNGSQWTVEDVHDIVASLSVDLLSAVGKIQVSGGFSNSCDKKRRHRNTETSELPESGTCHCNISGNKILSPVECICHPSKESFTRKANAPANSHLRFGSKFVFRDGVLVHMHLDKDVSYHCKFETLCLCSLIQLIVMTKPPFH
ncbi:uncharacterized protein LOC126787623 [Argentina anserina]|uniref:uncharacterized protein LOC126787623 n=1 Tax=Argentina anserina TaxID=57926 RepID=UPI00217631D0|nr:uncharacterized protein LOC126787623 [Potentilla anserina]